MLKKTLLILAALHIIFGNVIAEHPRSVTVLSVAKEDVTFQLFTRSNPDINTPLVIGELTGIPIDGSKPFKFIIHGYTHSANKTWVINMRKAFLENADCNVVAVDWSGPALSAYNLSAAFTKDVAVYVAQLIIELFERFGASYANMHLVGHSLGAHVSGFTGQNILASKSQKIGRITGMDPASPLFSYEDATDRLSADDATFVDVIHTDVLKFGYYDKCGDVDFYPNGGAAQPGCLTRDALEEVECAVACNHCRSFDYFTESIKSLRFIAKQCPTYVDYKNGNCGSYPSAIMGEHIDQAARGVFYLRTNSRSPFAKN